MKSEIVYLDMIEVFFLVEESPEGGYTARALGESIFTEGETLQEIRGNIKEAVQCHFDEDKMPKVIRLHLVKEETLIL